jgi:hypothetical protein
MSNPTTYRTIYYGCLNPKCAMQFYHDPGEDSCIMCAGEVEELYECDEVVENRDPNVPKLPPRRLRS